MLAVPGGLLGALPGLGGSQGSTVGGGQGAGGKFPGDRCSVPRAWRVAEEW